MERPSLDGIRRPPTGETARRVEWDMLPPALRKTIEGRLGSPVLCADSARGGFTPGFASVLTCADGSKHFVKSANVVAQKAFAQSYREEIRRLTSLPTGLPVPRLLWSLDQDWVTLETAYVEGRLPSRPWRPEQLDAALDALEDLAERLTPPPAGMVLDTFAREYSSFVPAWDYLRRALPDLPHGAEAAALAARLPELTGQTVVHTDVRDDNVVLDRGGRAWLCDWNWPALGPAWVDTVFTLIGPYGDGMDTDRILRKRALTREVDPDLVDVALALLAGYFLRQRDQPVPNSSPFLRQHQHWLAEATWAWLCERRGWPVASTLG